MQLQKLRFKVTDLYYENKKLKHMLAVEQQQRQKAEAEVKKILELLEARR